MFPPLLNTVQQQGDASGASEVRHGTSFVHFHCPAPRTSSHIVRGTVLSKLLRTREWRSLGGCHSLLLILSPKTVPVLFKRGFEEELFSLIKGLHLRGEKLLAKGPFLQAKGVLF